jgi:putative membrane protein
VAGEVSGTGDGKTDLSATRTALAAERTLMAWVRTSLSMISFGFTIYKFFKGMHQAGALTLRRPEEPRNLGLFLVALGTASLCAGLVEHVRTLRQIPGPRRRLSGAFYMSCAVLILGFVVLVGLIQPEGPP